jgi:hypothetical protein
MDDSYGGSPSRSAIAVMSGITTLLNFKFSNPDRQSRSHMRIIDGGYRRRYRSPRSAGSNQDRLRIGTGSTRIDSGSTTGSNRIDAGSKTDRGRIEIPDRRIRKRKTLYCEPIENNSDLRSSRIDFGSVRIGTGSTQDRVRIESGSAVDRARSTNRHRLIRWILRSGRCDLEA